DPLLLAVTYIGSEIASPGEIRYSGGAEIVFGELDGSRSERARRVAACFEQAGIKHRLSTHIRHVKWDKLAWNAGFNAVSALTRRTVIQLLDRGPAESLVRDTMTEVSSVAFAQGIELRSTETSIARSRTLLPDFRTSMLQDVERGKRLEHDAI